MTNCKRCKRGIIRFKDFGFMTREICNFCGDSNDIPNPKRIDEYNQRTNEAIDHRLEELEG